MEQQAKERSHSGETTSSHGHLGMDEVFGRDSPIHSLSAGKIIAFPQVGGLHHRYERRAA
jgi:hypothetical protein